VRRLGQALGWYRPGEGAGPIGAVIGATIVLFVYGRVGGRRRAIHLASLPLPHALGLRSVLSRLYNELKWGTPALSPSERTLAARRAPFGASPGGKRASQATLDHECRAGSGIPARFLVVMVCGVLWLFFNLATFEWNAVATLAVFVMALFIQRDQSAR
jgi:Transglycosylase associated protein